MSESRPIRTDYYFNNKLVRTNRAKHPNSAILRCIDHMQLNSYGATSAEVYDENRSELHAVVTRSISNKPKIALVFKREIEGAKE
jgi:hypothetical protein